MVKDSPSSPGGRAAREGAAPPRGGVQTPRHSSGTRRWPWCADTIHAPPSVTGAAVQVGWRAGLEPPPKGHLGLEQVDWARPWRLQHSGLIGWCHPDHGPGDKRRKDLFSFNKIYFSFGRQLNIRHPLSGALYHLTFVHATRNPEAQSEGIISLPLLGHHRRCKPAAAPLPGQCINSRNLLVNTLRLKSGIAT